MVCMTNMQTNRTPLIAASDSGFADIVKLLVEEISKFPDKEKQAYLDHKKHVSYEKLTTSFNFKLSYSIHGML